MSNNIEDLKKIYIMKYAPKEIKKQMYILEFLILMAVKQTCVEME